MLRSMRSQGFALMELMVAFGIVAMAMAIGILAFRSNRAVQEKQAQRAAAHIALEIGLERISALDLSTLPQPEKSASFPIHPEFASFLPKAEARLRCASVQDQPRLWRLCLSIQWGEEDERVEAEMLVENPASKERSAP